MQKITKQQAEEAIQTLLKYLGEDINREGLKDTPRRVINSYKELFSGYSSDIEDILSKKFSEPKEYDGIILLRDIKFTSICEHHMLPFTGKVDIAYIPDEVVVGVSKLARLVETFARRLQIQERMTTQIVQALDLHLKPKGIAILVTASHNCMAFRGVMKEGSCLETSHFSGSFKESQYIQNQFWQMVKS